MIIAIDFDGTCVKHAYPRIGEDIGAIPVLKQLVKDGHQLILNTMRGGELLGEAVKWFNDNGIKLSGANHTPGQATWTTSPKVYAQLYIDDAALGCPTIMDDNGRVYVDWRIVAKAFGYDYNKLIGDGTGTVEDK
jgi:hypothetical protein